MMSKYVFQQIRKLRQEGLNRSEIQKKLNLNWKTVDKYWKSNTPPEAKKREHRTRVNPVAAFEEQIQNLLDTVEGIKSVDLYERLKMQGYPGSERTLRRRVAEILEGRPKERFFEQEYLSAEQTQFDFKEKVELPFLDGMRMVNLHYGSLPCSGRAYVWAYPSLNFECFMDGVHRFFETIGGVTLNIRIDNLAPCVQAVLKGRQRKWTSAFERAIQHYGFGVLPCNPAKGNEKGHVERDIQTFTRRLKVRVQLEGVQFKDWEHLNEWLKNWIEQEPQQIKTQEKFKEEAKSLLPLAARKTEVLCKVETVVASAYGTVRLDHCVYSVPDTVIGMSCNIVRGPYDVKIYRSGKLLATHPRASYGKESILLSHVLYSLNRKPQAMIRWSHREVLFPEPIFKKYYNYLKKINSSFAEREYLRSLNLIHHTDLKELAQALEVILELKCQKPFDDLRELLLVEKTPCPIIDITGLLGQQPLQPKLSDYDSLIPNSGEKTYES